MPPAHAQADIANDNKAAQLEDNVNTLLGLDANRLCRWDMRDPRGVVQVRVCVAGAEGGSIHLISVLERMTVWPGLQ